MYILLEGPDGADRDTLVYVNGDGTEAEVADAVYGAVKHYL